MALSDSALLKIKVDYEAGKLSKGQIGKKHGISQPTLRKHAEQGEWNFQKNFQKVSKIVEEKTYERLIEKEVDRFVLENDKYSKEIDYITGLTLAYIAELAQNKKNKTLQKKEDADRIFSFLKSCKISSETINMNYNGKRKMLGMDKDEDIRKARAIKQSDQAQEITDPLEGKTIEDVKAEIEKLNG